MDAPNRPPPAFSRFEERPGEPAQERQPRPHSVYHHFPGGRVQLIEEAVALAGDFISGLIEAATRSHAPLEAVDAFFALWRERLVSSDFRSGCPIVAVAVEANDEAPQLARSAAAVFTRWAEALAAMFARHGLAPQRGHRLAAFIIAAPA